METDDSDNALKMLLQADVGTRVLFLGTLFLTKSTAWATSVLIATATRPRYAPLLYGGAGGYVLRRFRSTFPSATRRIDALAARASRSRSAQFLGKATGTDPAQMAPAAAEAQEKNRKYMKIQEALRSMLSRQTTDTNYRSTMEQHSMYMFFFS